MFNRSQLNPILKPNPQHNWESLKVYNPGVIYENGVYHLWYNAVGEDWTLRLGYACSSDGLRFKTKEQPVFGPSEPYDKKGVMDPRITKIGNTYYMTYSADNYVCRQLALATSKNLVNWTRHGLMLKNWDVNRAGVFRIVNGKKLPEKKERKGRSKAGGIFPRKISGKFWMIFGNSYLWMATSEDGINWYVDYDTFLNPREGNYFDNLSVQGGPPPIETDRGWLYLYHGRNLKRGDYRLGFLILDSKNPKQVIYRTPKPVFKPKEAYETIGLVDILEGGFNKMKRMTAGELKDHVQRQQSQGKMPAVVFCCGAIVVNGDLKIYYGAGDTVIGIAQTKLNNILRMAKLS